MKKNKFLLYYNKVVQLIKQIINDDGLTAEEKVRLLGTIL